MESQSPDQSEISGTGRSAVIAAVDGQSGGHDNGASEEQGSPATEKSPAQEKIDLVMNMVRSKNAMLGGRIGMEMKIENDSVFVFGVSVDDPKFIPVRAYGVHSKYGPVSLGTAYEVNTVTGKVDLDKVQEDLRKGNGRVIPITEAPRPSGYMMDTLWYWSTAYKRSVESILKDPEAMKQIGEQRVAVLDKALEEVSKPIDVDSSTNRQPDVSETNFGVAHAVPEDRAAMDRQSAGQSSMQAKQTL